MCQGPVRCYRTETSTADHSRASVFRAWSEADPTLSDVLRGINWLKRPNDKVRDHPLLERVNLGALSLNPKAGSYSRKPLQPSHGCGTKANIVPV